MTGKQYNNLVRGTIANYAPENKESSVVVAKAIFDNCGVALPDGDSRKILKALMTNDYMGWRLCTYLEAQQAANGGVAAIGINDNRIVVITPDAQDVLEESPATYSTVAQPATNMATDDLLTMQFFAYTAAATATVYASVCTASTATLTTSQKTANAQFILDYLRNQGFTKQAACGVIGNIQRECILDPGMWETLNSTSSGYGLVQWTPATVFLNWAVSNQIISTANASSINAVTNNDPKKLMNAELDCLIHCCTSRGDFFDPAWNVPAYPNHTGYVMTFAQYKASTLSAYNLAIVFNDHYERSPDSLSTIQNTRATYASDWYSVLV